MLTKEEKFKEFLRLKGIANDIYVPRNDSNEEKLLAFLRRIVERMVGEDILNLDVKINLFLINNDYINAGTTKIDDEYYIGLNTGLIRGIKDFVENFVLDKLPTHIKEYKLDARTIRFFSKDDTEDYIIGNYIANDILYLILFHELGHIFYGHCDKVVLRNMNLVEANSFRVGSIKHQAIEFLADFCEVINSMGLQNAANKISKETYTNAISVYLISLYSLYCYYENRNLKAIDTYEELVKRTHPHPAIRMLYMIELIENEIEFQIDKLYKMEWEEKDVRIDNVKEAMKKMMVESFGGSERQEENIIDRYINQLEVRNVPNEIIMKAYMDLIEFADNHTADVNLLSEMYSENYVKIRQKIQNTAIEINEMYREVSLVKLKEVGYVADKYVSDIIELNDMANVFELS